MKIEGTQDIPSGLNDSYRATLNYKRPDGTVQKRVPFKYPNLQAGGKKVSAAQLAQRTRFLAARNLFANTSVAERQRWYAAMPEWNSLLWYYNYFMMSALAGNANDQQGGIGVVKSIQVVDGIIATTGETSINISTVDAAKTVVFLFGNSFISDIIHRGSSSVAEGGTDNIALSPNVNPDISEVRINGNIGFVDIAEGTGDGASLTPYVDALIASQLTVKMANKGYGQTSYYDWEIIEHKSQTIYPIIKEINASDIKLGWPIEPDEATTISAMVIEYI